MCGRSNARLQTIEEEGNHDFLGILYDQVRLITNDFDWDHLIKHEQSENLYERLIYIAEKLPESHTITDVSVRISREGQLELMWTVAEVS